MSPASAETASVDVTANRVKMVKLHHRAKLMSMIWSYRYRDIAVFRFFKMAAVRHLGFVVRVLGPFGGLYRCAKFGRNR